MPLTVRNKPNSTETSDYSIGSMIVGNISQENEQTSLYDFSDVPQWAVTTVLIYLVFVFALGVTGNALLTCVQFKKENKFSTDVLILTMAVNDFICSLVYVPILWVRRIDNMWNLAASSTLCKLLPFLGNSFGLITMLLLVVIAIDRYMKTCWPLRPFFSKERAKRLCPTLVLLGILLGVPSLLAYTLDQHLNCKVTYQFENMIEKYNMFVITLTILTLIIMTFTYSKVGLAIQKRHIHHVNTHRKGEISCIEAWPMPDRSRYLNLNLLHRRTKIFPAISEQSPESYDPKPHNRSQTTAKSSLSIPRQMVTKKVDNKNITAENTQAGEVMTAEVIVIPSDESKTLPMQFGKLTDSKRNISEQQLGPACKRNNNVISNAESVCERKGSATAERFRQPLSFIQRKKLQEEKTANRITLILFLKTFFYALTFVLQWILILSGYSLFGIVAIYFSLTANLANVVSNPLFIFCLNSRSREELKQLIICK